ncbi:plasmid maintenance toxin (PemK-like) [Rhizobium sp. TH2]|uniref:plasmid maintenance toxin (PemK-like) n=1 Tax=Rhizobium sp. TH2 TaxID=2775403 RepID=UPI002157BABD|nr:plasmid maintenance toxin (PemK-like) [Rhizobium sp. TH2]UVC08349.1 plasmid maintenance toxin (PemK-like) [Rhizobium sp. TH2]
MFPSDIRVGYVFRYSYLWHEQYRQGRVEGDKDRPCLVLALVKIDENGNRIVRVLPITHTPPGNPGDAVEIPHAVKTRLKLDDERSWIILTESNRFIWPGPDVRPLDTENGYYGPLPPTLFRQVKERFVAIAKSASHRAISRTD